MEREAFELKVSTILVVTGVGIFMGSALLHAGAQGAMATLLVVNIIMAVNLVLGLIACMITAKLLSVSFGDLRTAIVKLAAIFIFPSAVAFLVPSVPLAWITSMVLYLSLIALFFEVEGWEIVIFAVVVAIVRFVAALVVGIVAAATQS